MTISSSCLNSNDIISIVSANGDLMESFNVSGSSCVIPKPLGDYYISIHRHNYYPYVVYCGSSNYIQNKTFNTNAYYNCDPLNIGYDVTTGIPYGNVVVKPNSKLTIQKGSQGVLIKNGFECEMGAEMIIE